jgi:aspartate racemase
LSEAAAALEKAGADFLVLCTNTMHRVAGAIESRVKIPLLHIADPTAQALKAAGISNVGLLGTRFTMEHDFYRGRLESTFGLTVLLPDAPDREFVHDVIYTELCRGVVSQVSRTGFQRVVSELASKGAQAVILGCTEIGLLLRPADVSIPLFDTTFLHATAAASLALATSRHP